MTRTVQSEMFKTQVVDNSLMKMVGSACNRAQEISLNIRGMLENFGVNSSNPLGEIKVYVHETAGMLYGRISLVVFGTLVN